MKKSPIFIVLISLLLTVSCGKKVSQIANTIPDHAFLVGSLNPKQIFEKGQISSMESLTRNVDNDLLTGIIEDPVKSGIDISEYAYGYIYFINDNPIIGMTAAIKDVNSFNTMMEEMLEKSGEEIILHEGYSMVLPENDDAGIAWNDQQVIFLLSPDMDFPIEDRQEEFIGLFELEKENAITSIVDFVDFSGKMKDMNVWFTGDQLKTILEKSGVMDEADIQLPMELYNNYGQLFVEFADGAMFVNSETHFSDDVTKAASSMLVAKDELNKDLLRLAPGNDLLMAMAFSLEIDNLVDIVQGVAPPDMDGMSDQIEQATGVPGEEILQALSGDFVIAVNGAEEGSSIPVEVLIGIGLDDESLQEKMMGSVGNMADVQKEGDFFMINANGIELYSGIINGIWVLTNTPGYKDAVTGKGIDKSLLDSEFREYSDGSMGMYMNLDLSTYPVALQGMLGQGGAPQMIQMVTSSFLYMGMEASNQENMMTLKTSNDDENSLYTLLQLFEKAALQR